MREAINPDGFSEREIRDALETALHSYTFVRTTRLCRFLRFVVEGALDGRDGELKEYARYPRKATRRVSGVGRNRSTSQPRVSRMKRRLRCSRSLI